MSPSCWDGENLDSWDHRSHMAYPHYAGPDRVCPSSHPVMLPEITFGFQFPNPGHTSQWHVASDRMANMTHANGSTFHADWFGA
ncbi:MAG: DUF1996 domain-containing protein [Ilumatobacteraceae bacterium]